MASTTAYIDVPHSPDHVWQLIGGFGSLPDWLPYIPHSELSEGGRVRSLKNEGVTSSSSASRPSTRTRAATRTPSCGRRSR